MLGQKEARVRLDPDTTPIGFAQILEAAGAKIVTGDDPCILPKAIKKEARRFFDEETDRLGYDKIDPAMDKAIFKTSVPKGTMYIAKGDRPAQVYFSHKIKANFIPTDVLPSSVRGENGKGSSGTK